jgi:hypothetical protein
MKHDETWEEVKQRHAKSRTEDGGNGKDDSLPAIHVEPGELPRMAEEGERALI